MDTATDDDDETDGGVTTLYVHVQFVSSSPPLRDKTRILPRYYIIVIYRYKLYRRTVRVLSEKKAAHTNYVVPYPRNAIFLGRLPMLVDFFIIVFFSPYT